MGLLDAHMCGSNYVTINHNLIVAPSGAYAIANICSLNCSSSTTVYEPVLDKWCKKGFLLFAFFLIFFIVSTLFLQITICLPLLAIAIFGLIKGIIALAKYNRQETVRYSEYYLTLSFSNGSSVNFTSISKAVIDEIAEDIAKVIQSRGQFNTFKNYQLPIINQSTTINQFVDQSQNYSATVGGNLNYVGDNASGNINIDSNNTYSQWHSGTGQNQSAGYQGYPSTPYYQ